MLVVTVTPSPRGMISSLLPSLAATLTSSTQARSSLRPAAMRELYARDSYWY
jgi:hypothetical protein